MLPVTELLLKFFMGVEEYHATIRPPAKREPLRSQAKSRELLPKVLRTSVVTRRTSTWRSSETSD